MVEHFPKILAGGGKSVFIIILIILIKNPSFVVCICPCLKKKSCVNHSAGSRLYQSKVLEVAYRGHKRQGPPCRESGAINSSPFYTWTRSEYSFACCACYQYYCCPGSFKFFSLPSLLQTYKTRRVSWVVNQTSLNCDLISLFLHSLVWNILLNPSLVGNTQNVTKSFAGGKHPESY